MFCRDRYLGGITLGEAEVDFSDQKLYIVSRDRSCHLYRKFYGNRQCEAVNHLYVLACFDFNSRLGLSQNNQWLTDIQFYAPPSVDIWKCLFPANSWQVSHSDKIASDQSSLKSQSHGICESGVECPQRAVVECFGVLYRPLPPYAHIKGGIAEMNSLVICLSGYGDTSQAVEKWEKMLKYKSKKRKHTNSDGQSHDGTNEDEFSHRYQIDTKGGRLELAHAIRLCGACHVQSFKP